MNFNVQNHQPPGVKGLKGPGVNSCQSVLRTLRFNSNVTRFLSHNVSHIGACALATRHTYHINEIFKSNCEKMWRIKMNSIQLTMHSSSDISDLCSWLVLLVQTICIIIPAAQHTREARPPRRPHHLAAWQSDQHLTRAVFAYLSDRMEPKWGFQRVFSSTSKEVRRCFNRFGGSFTF